jgi:hypothetical protein
MCGPPSSSLACNRSALPDCAARKGPLTLPGGPFYSFIRTAR